jgi:AraC family transcriptional regulator of adaptative response / DNA-3-methyladenine glycosylase II
VQDGEPAQLTVHAPPGETALVLEVHGAPAGSLLNLVNRARRTFDVSVDPQKIQATFGRDPLLASLVQRCPGPRIPGVWDGFECAVHAVLSQGSPEAEQRLVSRLVRSCGSRLSSSPDAAAPLTHLFPTAQALAAGSLGGIGLAAPQVAAVTALAEAFIKRRLDFEESADEISRVLLSLPGMNESTAEYIALRGLGEPRGAAAHRPAEEISTKVE